MSMSTHVVGFKAPDAKWKQMKTIYDACKEAKVEPPDEVVDFFEGEPPDDIGVEVDIERTNACEKWSDDAREGYIVEVAKLPKDLTHIRFYNSW